MVLDPRSSRGAVSIFHPSSRQQDAAGNQTENATATKLQPHMPKLSEVFKSEYLKADDIPEEGMILTISEVEIKELGQGKDKEVKPVVSFNETDKTLVCNKTNCNTIHKLTGSDDTDDWAGHKIKLITMEVQFQDKLVNSIRVSGKPVKAAPSKAAKPALVEPEEGEYDQNIPF